MLERVDFARAANQEFDVFVGEGTVTMTLTNMEPRPGKFREAFVLTFKSASPIVLPQQTYWMRNKSLADAQKVEVFIVPVGREPDGVLYQAVFN